MKRNAELTESAARVMQNMTRAEYNQLTDDEKYALRSRWYEELRNLYPDKAIATIRSAIAFQLRNQE